MKTLEDFVKPTQGMLFDTLRKTYGRKATVCKENYILVKGEAPVMLLAHLDTVHKEPVREICKSESGTILMSPQGIGGDDRCGVYALTTVYEKSHVKPWLLFTCNEEVGGVGAEKFAEMHTKKRLPKALDNLKLLIEIDRKGKNDAVYYDCDNPELEAYITSKGFVTAWGSYSDISTVAPELGVAAVNLSSGYYNAHTLHEYINRKHLNSTVKKVTEIVAEAAKPDFPKFEYIVGFKTRWGFWEGYGGGVGATAKTPKKKEAFLSDDDFDIYTIPADIRDDYEELLGYYTVAELEAVRNEFGDRGIPMMCKAELGFSYAMNSRSPYWLDDVCEEK